MSLMVIDPATVLICHCWNVQTIFQLLFPNIAFRELEQTVVEGVTSQYPNTSAPVQVSKITGSSSNELVSKTLTRTCMYIATWSQILGDDDYLQKFLAAMACQPKPWTKRSVAKAFPDVNTKVKQRGVRDFDVGNLVGGHAGTAPNASKPIKMHTLEGLEDFSKELIILESLLPLYLENT